MYVSDKPGEHDFELLKKLVLPDGSVLRAMQPARPCRDSLFTDVLRDGKSLLKVPIQRIGRGARGSMGRDLCCFKKQEVSYMESFAISDAGLPVDIPHVSPLVPCILIFNFNPIYFTLPPGVDIQPVLRRGGSVPSPRILMGPS